MKVCVWRYYAFQIHPEFVASWWSWDCFIWVFHYRTEDKMKEYLSRSRIFVKLWNEIASVWWDLATEPKSESIFFWIIDKGFGVVFGRRRTDTGRLSEIRLFSIPEAGFPMGKLAVKGIKGVWTSTIKKEHTQGWYRGIFLIWRTGRRAWKGNCWQDVCG